MAITAYYNSDDISTYGYGDSYQVSGILGSNLNGIFGIPYQFMDTVDPRPAGSDIGVKYMEKIVSRMPLLFLTPCRQVFMPGMDDATKESTLQSLVGNSGATTASSGKYYTTEWAYSDYYNYVNVMCTQACKFAGVANDDVWANGTIQKMGSINWMSMKNESFNDYFAASNAVVFYLDGFSSISDSFSNSTMESSLASMVNGYSDQAKEIKFLLGNDSALAQMYNAAGEITGSITNALGDTIGDLAGGMLGSLASKGVNTIVKGGKIIFPKIWQDFSYDRSSYSFSIKLRSPDHDTMSILWNVIIPYIHILGMVLPIGLDDDPNGFISPFLVKAYCKGMFNIEMGLITSLSATKGAECQWNDDGLPTQIDIDITIEDLYSSLFMTPLDGDAGNTGTLGQLAHVVKNTAMMDFLSNLVGLNVAEEEKFRTITMYKTLITSQVERFFPNLWNKFDTDVANFMAKMFHGHRK